MFGEISKVIAGIRIYAGGDFEERISWKLKVLNALRDAGVWLEDASISGVYGLVGGDVSGRILPESHARKLPPVCHSRTSKGAD